MKIVNNEIKPDTNEEENLVMRRGSSKDLVPDRCQSPVIQEGKKS